MACTNAQGIFPSLCLQLKHSSSRFRVACIGFALMGPPKPSSDESSQLRINGDPAMHRLALVHTNSPHCSQLASCDAGVYISTPIYTMQVQQQKPQRQQQQK